MMRLFPFDFVTTCVSISALLVCLLSSSGLQARQTSDMQFSRVDETSVGFDKNLRLGHWTPVTFHLNPTTTTRPTSYEITCIDGDGTTVTYRSELEFDQHQPNAVQASFRLGRVEPKIEVKLFANDEMIEQFPLTSDTDFIVRPSTQRMILVVEPSERIVTTINETISGLKSKPIVAGTEELADLPLNWKCYRGINQLILSAQNLNQIAAIGTARLDAIKRWLNDGGHLILCVGQGGEELLAEGQPLQALCPGTFAGVFQLDSSKRIEFFASGSKSQLLPDDTGKTIPTARIDDTTGVVALTENDAPLIIEQSFGLGRLTFVAFDLDSDLFNSWTGTGNLIRKIVFSDEETAAAQFQSGGRVSHYGYEDLVGQLRVPLDQFSQARMVTFTWVAVLIALFILCIGPGDYFLLRKVVGRMELTWITFGLMTVAFCALAWFAVKNTKPSRIQLNQLEVVDIDALSGKSKGTIWANLFSPTTKNLNLELASVNEFGFEIRDSEIIWHGLPGNGLGGMGTSAATAIAGEDYQIVTDNETQSRKIRMDGLPMRVSSSRAVFAIWNGDAPMEPLSRLKYNPRIQQLEGTLTNPLDKPLANCRILFEDWVYVVGRRLEPGETIDILTETREKNARSYYNRKVSKDDKGGNTPWDPTDTRINRIAEMMLFYESAGGRGYTGLSHDYQAFVDLSHVPNLNRAVLVGEIDGRATDILIDGEPPSPNSYDRQLTILRVSLPVQRPQREKPKTN